MPCSPSRSTINAITTYVTRFSIPSRCYSYDKPLMLYEHVLPRCGATVETRLPKDEVDLADNLLTKST